MTKGKDSKEFKFEFIFTKRGLMRYISHLDLIRLFMRAARRADLPFCLTKGFHPHIKLKLKRALKLGLESEREEAEIFLTRNISSRVFLKSLNKQFPEGVKIEQVLSSTL